MTLFNRTTTLALGAALAPLPTVASAQTLDAGNVISMSDWQVDDLYTGGVSLERLMDDAEVYGPNGEEIGSVENVVIGSDGRVLSIIAQVGGFWDIADTHVNVPWSQVEMTAADRVVIPVTEETAEDYSLYKDEMLTRADATGSVQAVDDDVEAVGRTWRATELIGDYARVREGDGYANYGYVNDVIVRDGQVAAVVVSPDVGYGVNRGPYAYPYYGYGWGWTPGNNYYDMPYAENEIGDMEAFDYDRMGTL